MKKSVSLLSNLLLSSTLFWAVPAVADEMVSSVPTDITAYCHLKFPRCVKILCHGSNLFLIRRREIWSISTGPVIMTRQELMRSEPRGACFFAAILKMEIK